MKPVEAALLGLCDAAGGGPSWTPPDLTAREWSRLEKRAARHGLAAWIYLAAREGPVRPPAATLGSCRAAYLGQVARESSLRAQLAEIGEGFEAASLPVLVLKGAAAIERLYAVKGARHLEDLDLLVPAERAEEAGALMARLGYTPAPAYNSAEMEWLHTRRLHLRPFLRGAGLPVEIHVGLFKSLPARALDEFWIHSLPGPGILRFPHPRHFALHTAVHYGEHLEVGPAPLRWLADLLLALRRASIHPEALLQEADRWQARKPVARVLEALERLWGVAPAGASPDPPLSARLLLEWDGNRRLAGLAGQRLAACRLLPGWRARGRYLLRLVVPEADHLRFRYGVPAGRSLGPYYLLHPFTLAARVAHGVTALLRR